MNSQIAGIKGWQLKFLQTTYMFTFVQVIAEVASEVPTGT